MADTPDRARDVTTGAPPVLSTRVARVYARLDAWANAGWANSVVFGWGALQATCVPGFVDIFYVPLALARPARAWRLAFAAAAGTILGSAGLYWAGASALAQLSGPVAAWLGVGPAELAQMHALLDNYGWLAILASTMSPLSTKLTSVASGAFNVPWWSFVAALSGGRLLRVSIIAWLIQHGGAERVARWLKVPMPSPTTDRAA